MSEAPAPFLVTVSGQDGPGISARLLGARAELGVAVDDVEQVRVHGRLLLCVEADMVDAQAEPVRVLLEERLTGAGVQVRVDPLVEKATDDVAAGHLRVLHQRAAAVAVDIHGHVAFGEPGHAQCPEKGVGQFLAL